MTLRDVIATVDALKPNQYKEAQKIRWLSECDANIYRTIVEVHELPEGMPATYDGYTEADLDKNLIAAPPYDILYKHYLERMIDLYNKELTSYNNTNVLYNTALNAFANWYTNTHMPRSRATHFKL